MVHRQKRKGIKPLLLNAKVTTSGRRWKENGIIPVFLVNQVIILSWHLGIPPEALKQIYYRKRKPAPCKDGAPSASS